MSVICHCGHPTCPAVEHKPERCAAACCDCLRAEVERMTKERAEDEAFESESEKLWGECEEELEAARAEVERLKAALRDMREHHCSCDFKEMDEDCWTCNRAREALGEVES